MRFWQTEFKNEIYTVDYDALTLNQDGEIRALIEHLELEWEDSCLEPENNPMAIKTASSIQARKPIYRNSSEQWRNFEPFLKGMFDNI
tara:strand:- start:201 stop:464 length:264 start_codon:yes stop_codon:yes gene_type:complete